MGKDAVEMMEWCRGRSRSCVSHCVEACTTREI